MNRLRYFRLEKKYTIEHLAKLSRVPKGRLSLAEHAEELLSDDILDDAELGRVCQILGLIPTKNVLKNISLKELQDARDHTTQSLIPHSQSETEHAKVAS